MQSSSAQPLVGEEHCLTTLTKAAKETTNHWTTSRSFSMVVTREFKKLRRQLQGKRHIKIVLCVKLSLLRLFHVDHVVQNR